MLGEGVVAKASQSDNSGIVPSFLTRIGHTAQNVGSIAVDGLLATSVLNHGSRVTMGATSGDSTPPSPNKVLKDSPQQSSPLPDIQPAFVVE